MNLTKVVKNIEVGQLVTILKTKGIFKVTDTCLMYHPDYKKSLLFARLVPVSKETEKTNIVGAFFFVLRPVSKKELNRYESGK